MLEIYEKSVTELKNDMINLGMKVEQAVDNAWKALGNMAHFHNVVFHGPTPIGF